jgi:hypothetical protein
MALAYLLDPSFQFVNESGRPLVGGHIEVFYHNSHLQYITKADFDGTNNPFEVPLNSKGMAVLIADVSNAYDVYCYDAFNSLFWSRENITTAGNVGDVNIIGDEILEFTKSVSGNDITFNGSVKDNSIGRDKLRNGHDLIPDSRYLKFTDFNGDVVISLSNKLQNFLTSGGFVP